MPGRSATGQNRAAGGAAVSIRNLCKRYNNFEAVVPTSVEIDSGDFFAIIGPSGSGKSTLLGMIAGYIDPTEGQIVVDGRDIVPEPIYRRNIGMVFQNYALFPHLSVAQNVAYPLKIRGVPKEEIARRVRESLAMVRLEAFASRKPSELSGGQQQRIALARASIYHPSILLMDEPLGALDKNLRDEMQEEIKRFQQELGATVIYVTHDQQEAAFLADRIAIMRDGSMTQIGSPRALYEQPNSRFVAEFLGEASIFPVKLAAGKQAGQPCRIVLEDGTQAFIRTDEATAPGSFACIRPERVTVGPKARGLDNAYTGIVRESLYTPGSIRYRIELNGTGSTVKSRVLPQGNTEVFETGSTVDIGWSADDMTILRE
ncbi:ATP-binding cassette domain-containing protein [Mesorhizobium sp. M2A.F.Ca.ET.037.01.1.1]|uniref:ABC transporter ATP-binding protein n=1 Tax=unclassified Mesorhizobium TaxID=325217 RepID=UPI000F752E80|nr:MULTISPECIES: ABC transporter ATP-binding protein [unclassified Mesorhizobium]AZO16107.1 ABC transporter ATP-binding protein [Mesorhizobium sp. M2A.F.Ca.ET.043.05.1.1]RUX18609.1 ATP-binding cassette domain-containing protein [Mesorhizobium sp. M2A.F.Ca.ET.037.01.1.1]RWA89275.1 MAG: ATP-binding cassette domain-containing protein [Mesorhizobium sp.]RWE80685.1 MAG: ATP-binding cassette domain-containing protein [Mesorhizobium sp.]TIV15814.1 MAG: ABC transporter ATP-binding protein [Mesorhizobi